MGELINKVTLYDIISFTIPGSLVLFCMMIVNKCVYKQIYLIVNNDLIILILFLLVSYCIGWILSELMNSIYTKIIFNKKICEYLSILNNCIYTIVISILLLVFVYYFIYKNKQEYILCFVPQKIYLVIIFIIIFFFEIKILYKNKSDNENKDEIKLLRHQCSEHLKNIYEFDLDYLDINTDDIIKKFNKRGYMMIQTVSKYGRMHNYNSSKSFSKNLSGACLLIFFLTGYFIIFDTYKDNTSMLLIIMFISNISFYLLALRYLDFSLKLNICTMSFWLDYIENRTNGNHYDE
ncbi:hypothetical protein [Thomasclavelia spiroformis]|uniref:hypothetical protein n=1 Tax=Thomasclavelia spiroformis TaxID=29348 RepID=UPI00320B3DD9